MRFVGRRFIPNRQKVIVQPQLFLIDAGGSENISFHVEVNRLESAPQLPESSHIPIIQARKNHCCAHPRLVFMR